MNGEGERKGGVVVVVVVVDVRCGCVGLPVRLLTLLLLFN